MPYNQSYINLIAFSVNIGLALVLVILLPSQKLECSGKAPLPGHYRTSKFGVDNFNGRLVDGTVYKFIASLQWNGRHFCAATIIGAHWAISSSKCTELYRTNLALVPETIPQFMYQVNETHAFFEIAFLRTVHPFKIIHFEAIGVSSSPKTKSEIRILRILPKLVLGWGVHDNQQIYHTLHATEMYLIDQVKCEYLYTDKKSIGFHQALNLTNLIETGVSMLEKNPRYFCAAMNNKIFKDTCDKDLGSPLIHNDKLLGFVSSQYKCQDLGYPGVYVNITEPSIYDKLKEMDLFYGIGIQF